MPRKKVLKNSILPTTYPIFSGCNMNNTNSLTFVLASVRFHFVYYYVICFVTDLLILSFNHKLQNLKKLPKLSH